MAKDDKQTELKQNNTVPTQKQDSQTYSPQPSGNRCPDCKGEGIKSLTDMRVCQTCEGRGTVGTV